jgi:hypothetical protein
MLVSSRKLDLKAGASQEVSWPFAVPAGTEQILWTLDVRSQRTPDRDTLRVTQRVSPAVP